MNLYFELILFVICIFPKINIINVSGNGAGLRIEDALIGFFVVLKLANVIRSGKIKIESHKMYKITKVFCFYIVVCFFSTLYGVMKGWINPILASLYLIRKIEYFCMIFIGYDYIKKMNDNKRLANMLDFCIIIHFILSILQMLGLIGSFNRGEMVSGLTQGRVSSTFNGAYEFSGFLLLFLPYYLFKAINEEYGKIKNIAFIFIILFCIFVSESRTSLVISGVIMFLVFFKTSSYSTKKIFSNIVICFAGISIIVGLIMGKRLNLKRFEKINISGINKVFMITWKNKNFDKYVNTRNWYGNAKYTFQEIEAAGMDASFYVRVSHWMQMIDGVIKSPLIGLGASISGGSADGNYIRIISESGVLGLLTYMYLIYVIYKNIKNNAVLSWFEYSILSIVMGAFLIDVFEASKIMMIVWFIIGIICCCEVKNEKST